MTNKDKQPYDGSTPLKSIQQELFVWNILQGMSQWDAYRNAGYKAKNPSSGSIQLRKNTKIEARLAYVRAKLQEELREKTGITQQKVVDEIARCAFANMQDFITNDAEGNIVFKDFEGLSRDQMAAVESVKITRTTTKNKKGDREYTTQHTQFKLHNKPGTLEQLGKHLGIFEADNGQRNRVPAMLLMFADVPAARRAIESRTIDSDE